MMFLTSLCDHKTQILAVENFNRFGNQMLVTNVLPSQTPIIFNSVVIYSMYEKETDLSDSVMEWQ